MNRGQNILYGLNYVIDLVMVNIVYLIVCMPLVTIGAATTAMNRVVVDIIYEEKGKAVKNFFVFFKRQFITSTRFFSFHLVLGSIFFYGFVITYRGINLNVWNVLFILLFFLNLILFQFGSYVHIERMKVRELYKKIILTIKEKWYLLSMYFLLDIISTYLVLYVNVLFIFIIVSFNVWFIRFIEDKVFEK